MTKQTDQIGAFAGLSHAELGSEYRACRERVRDLEVALRRIRDCTAPGCDDLDVQTAHMIARAILAEAAS